jgi:hypothetical protein
MTRKGPATLALFLVAGLGLIACGGGGETTDPQEPGSSSIRTETSDTARDEQAGAAARHEERPENDSKAPRAGAAEKAVEPQRAGAGSSRGKQPGKKSNDDPRDDGKPGYRSDEERCAHEPSTCGPDEETPSYDSNPDVRRAEERAEEPEEPKKCYSSDCEELRSAER